MYKCSAEHNSAGAANSSLPKLVLERRVPEIILTKPHTSPCLKRLADKRNIADNLLDGSSPAKSIQYGRPNF